ncbi:hypothetical protein HMI56_001024, partial [Coelomomyces lativittatus]
MPWKLMNPTNGLPLCSTHKSKPLEFTFNHWLPTWADLITTELCLMEIQKMDSLEPQNPMNTQKEAILWIGFLQTSSTHMNCQNTLGQILMLSLKGFKEELNATRNLPKKTEWPGYMIDSTLGLNSSFEIHPTFKQKQT